MFTGFHKIQLIPAALSCFVLIGLAGCDQRGGETATQREFVKGDQETGMFQSVSQPVHVDLGPQVHFEFYKEGTQTRVNEVYLRNMIEVEVHRHFEEKNFTKLEQFLEIYRGDNGGALTGSGLYKESLFYGTFFLKSHILRKHLHNNYEVLPWADEHLNLWMKEFPDSPAPYIAKALTLLDLVYVANSLGNASPNAVEWRQKKLRAAEAYLSTHWDKMKDERDAHRVRLLLALEAKDAEEKWRIAYEAARESAPGYYQIYFNALLWAPNYGNAGGPVALTEKLAADHLNDAGAENKSGYARLFWVGMQNKQSMFLLLRARLLDWKPIRDSFYDLLQDYPDVYNAQAFAYFSCVAGDRKTFRQLNAKIGDEQQYKALTPQIRELCAVWSEHRGPDVFRLQTEPIKGGGTDCPEGTVKVIDTPEHVRCSRV